MNTNEYQCAMCQGVFTKEHSDEEAMAETQSYWSGVTQQDCDVVCDDCWQKIHPETHPEEYQASLLEMEIQGTDNLTEKLLIVNRTLEKICTVFAVPPSILGEPNNTNYNARWQEQIDTYRQRFFRKKKS